MPEVSTKIAVDEIIQNETNEENILIENEVAILTEFIECQVYMLHKSFKTLPYFAQFYEFNVGHYEQWALVSEDDCEYLATTFNNERGDICWMCDVESFKIKYPF